MAKVTTAVVADNLSSLHTKCVIHMSLHSSGDRVEVGWPATAGLELVVGRVERGVAASTGIYTLRRVMGIVFSSAGALGAFLTEYTELLCMAFMLVRSRIRYLDPGKTNQGSEQLSIDPHFVDRGMTCLQMILRCWLSS
jgi:hypothetical protein